ncbi:MAG: AAC(3) family N-acetyltransferase [Anaerolineales bacterium]|nr:AAC(3) family N-acetyltransferase [Anaerolineales bacterium]
MARKIIGFHDLVEGLRGLRIVSRQPVIAHASLSVAGEIQGGVETALGAMLHVFSTLIMPAFTYKTMLTPQTGPPDNGIVYGSRADANRMVEFFHPDMPADRLMGMIPEALRRHPQARRSSHPILSFTGVNAGPFLESQRLDEPLAPIRRLVEAKGWVLLFGVDHTVNTSIHYVERLARRKQFIRWALTPQGVVECPHFPGCSDGFNALTPWVEPITRWVKIGEALIRALPLVELVEIACARIESDPLALLCDHANCERCQSVREWTASQIKIREKKVEGI